MYATNSSHQMTYALKVIVLLSKLNKVIYSCRFQNKQCKLLCCVILTRTMKEVLLSKLLPTVLEKKTVLGSTIFYVF